MNEELVILTDLQKDEKSYLRLKNGLLYIKEPVDDEGDDLTYINMIKLKKATEYVKGRAYLILYKNTMYYTISPMADISDINTSGIREVMICEDGTISSLDDVYDIVSSCIKIKEDVRNEIKYYIDTQDVADLNSILKKYENSYVKSLIYSKYDINYFSKYESSINLLKEVSKPLNENLENLTEAILFDDIKTEIIREFLYNVVNCNYDKEDYKEFFKGIFDEI